MFSASASAPLPRVGTQMLQQTVIRPGNAGNINRNSEVPTNQNNFNRENPSRDIGSVPSLQYNAPGDDRMFNVVTQLMQQS